MKIKNFNKPLEMKTFNGYIEVVIVNVYGNVYESKSSKKLEERI
jgi:hypothetical protein